MIPRSIRGGGIAGWLFLCSISVAQPALAQNQSEIQAVQQRLGQLGYEPGEPDGLMGAQTETAVMEFQHDMGLDETGEITLSLINILGVHPSNPLSLDEIQARLVDIIGAKWEEGSEPSGPRFWTPPAPELVPVFADYPITAAPDPLVEHVDMSSHPDASLFEDALNAAVGQPADFAGLYRVVTVGCGTSCEAVVIVDASNGQVFTGPTAEFGIAYQVDSRLIAVNPIERVTAAYAEGEIPAWAGSRWFVFDGSTFHVLTIADDPAADDPAPGAEQTAGQDDQ